jgi:hypothetical protein
MAKCIERQIDGKVVGYYVWCQGCKAAHFFPTTLPHPQRWTFSGTLERPTFTPSLLLYWTDPQTKQRITVCHTVVTDGRIAFQGDCPFDLKGQTLDLEHIPDDYGIPGRN